jgi:hypothetical protein
LVPHDSLDTAAKVEQIASSLEPIIRELHQQHPIQARMLSAIFKRFLEVIRLSTLKLAPEEFTAKAVPLLTGAKELSAWLVDPKNEPSLCEIQADIDSWASGYVSTGIKGVADFAETLRRAWLGKPRGRPVERRQAAIEALEAKLANPNIKWEDLAERLYPSAKDENINSPAQALRQEVIALRKVLKKYGIPGSAPFERHPGTQGPGKATPR